MKKIIDDIIHSFTRDEYREFKYFLLRRDGDSENRKDLVTLDEIRNKTTPAEKNDNAFYQVKWGLKKNIEQFIALENRRRDDAAEISVKIDIARYLFHKNLFAKAWHFLIKAEEMAEKANEYRLLDEILEMQISYSYNIAIPTADSIFIPDLLNKRLKNKAREMKESNTNAAYCELIYEIKKNFSENTAVNIEELKAGIFKKYNFEENHDANNLTSYCNYINVILAMFREETNYKELRARSINCYDFFSSNNLLGKIPDAFMCSLLDHICASTIRTKDYANYEKFIPLHIAYSKKLQGSSPEKTYYGFSPYTDLADLYIVTNRLPQARENLLAAKEKYAFTKSTRIFYLLRLNLIAMHYMHMEYGECIKLYQEFVQYDERDFLNELFFNLESLFLTEIYGILFYYEDGDTYYALHLLTQIKRKFAAELKTEKFSREAFFIKILQKILKTPSYLKTKTFLSDTEKFVSLKQFMPGDWEYISLNVWLVSKTTNRNYYECFLEEVKP